MTAFYVREDDGIFSPTEYTIGPWSKNAQHGGPPAALLGRAIEREAGPEKQIVRVTLDILRPVPLLPLTITTEVVRPGKRVALLESSMAADGETVMRASAWAMRIAELDIPNTYENEDPPGPPDLFEPMGPSKEFPEKNYLRATEWRFECGGFFEPGPAVAWLRTRVPLVEDEDDSPLVKVLAVADSASGVSGALDFSSWLYINTDLSLYLHRMPEGQWIRIDARTTPERTGVATTSATLSDQRGRIGASSQALFIAPR